MGVKTSDQRKNILNGISISENIGSTTKKFVERTPAVIEQQLPATTPLQALHLRDGQGMSTHVISHQCLQYTYRMCIYIYMLLCYYIQIHICVYNVYIYIYNYMYIYIYICFRVLWDMCNCTACWMLIRTMRILFSTKISSNITDLTSWQSGSLKQQETRWIQQQFTVGSTTTIGHG